ncbi:FAD-binding oxidoreductase [Marivirga atlantica]|jgi:FAD/FMN-containing dehydrogenase|uniref:FAD-binding oxidoreductase n=1 Tax=Marivirga atlantica TaxID=1548457 RepID=A0A937ADJ4_9BACT|nr:FAD-binding oxidoreductase [Marivirga atlantica]MBL0766830.1 FAD-binding oxidoreductase [Marivirga atlantica]
MQEITNWNLYPKVKAEVKSFTSKNELARLSGMHFDTIRGNGRSYGDASLGAKVIDTTAYNKVLSFDTEKGIITAQSGVLLSDLLEIIVPKGWFLPVTPGTKFITLGGAVASDVHGKNHHKEGAFSNHIEYLTLLDAHGNLVQCSKQSNSEIFKAACGGMGLTGPIVEISLRLKAIETAYIKQKQIKAKNLENLLPLFEENASYTYSVAWIDCLKKGENYGRSILMLGEHATKEEVKSSHKLKVPKSKALSIPFNFPSFTLNNFTIGAFNQLYYSKNISAVKEMVTPYEGFFYPLDNILHWNRIYGKKGFLQYQFVIPKNDGGKGIIKIMKMISNRGMTSFLAVLKTMGPEDTGYLSFPKEGYTLALDFPIRKGLFEFLDELDKVVIELGGRLYLAKDARMSASVFHKTYPNIELFREAAKKTNLSKDFNSDLNKRLSII